jgi:ADP-heptose:LPS heptosyltransferase
MADPWRPTLRKRLILSSLDLIGRVVPGFNARVDGELPPHSDVRSILVIELWNIGDLVLMLPFLGQLRAKFPSAKITLLARSYAREVLEGTGVVDEYIPAELGWSEDTTGRNPLRSRLRELLRVRKALRSRRFDLAFKSRMHVREHFLLALTPARRKVAYAFGSGDGALTDPIDANVAASHKSDDWIGLLAPFGGAVPAPEPRISPSPSEARWADEFLAQHEITRADFLIGIHPGASVPEKRWPLDRFLEVTRALATNDAIRVLAFADETGYGAELRGIPGIALAEKLSIRQLIALISRCRMLLCNDSGPMHLAAAMGIPVIAVFGAGVEKWFAPLGAEHTILKADSAGGAVTTVGSGVKDVGVATVLDAIAKMLPAIASSRKA